MKTLTKRRYRSLWMLFAEGIVAGAALSSLSITAGLILGGLITGVAVLGIVAKNLRPKRSFIDNQVDELNDYMESSVY